VAAVEEDGETGLWVHGGDDAAVQHIAVYLAVLLEVDRADGIVESGNVSTPAPGQGIDSCLPSGRIAVSVGYLAWNRISWL
jgi:hypothetical protein